MPATRNLADQAIDQLTREAHAFLNQGRHDLYLEIMQRAAEIDPVNHRVPIDVGVSFLRRYDYFSAKVWFERAVAGTHVKVDVLESIAFYCRNLMRYDLALHYLQQAGALSGATATTFAKLSEMYERSRQLDNANEAVDRALKIQPTSAMALLVRARLERSAGQLETGERTIRALLQHTEPAFWSARIRAWYELGANLDLQGRYDEAMAAFVAAKTATVPQAFRGMDTVMPSRHPTPQAAADLSMTILQRWSDEAREGRHPQRPVALLCGHPRSGTTLLEQILDSHPQIVAVEETPVFAEACQLLKKTFPAGVGLVAALDGLAPESIEKQRAWYFDSIEKFHGEPIAQRMLLDKNPALTGNLLEVLRFFPDIRLILALRDPRDVCLSCFMQPLPLNPVSASYLTLEATAKEYATIMGFWLAIKPRLLRPALEVRYEDMVVDTEHWARQALTFLGVDWDPVVLDFHVRARQKLVRSPSYAAVAKPVSNRAVGRWKNYEKFLQPALQYLKPFAQAFGYDA
jgi:Tfp pilus assembly protein PilF